MSRTIITYQDITWINIDTPTINNINYLKHKYGFHTLVLEDCLSDIERPKIDQYDDYLFVVMQFPVFDPSRRISQPSEVNMFIGRNYFVTLHKGTLKPLVLFSEQCQADEEMRIRFLGKGTGFLMHTIVDRLVDYIFPILYKVDNRISRLEEDIFEENPKKIVQEISLIRRDIISLRRIIKPQIDIITNIKKRSHPFIKGDLEDYFDDILDHSNTIKDILDEHDLVVSALSQTIDSLLSHRINEVMRTLTVISIIMLPLTLISGIYGMNVALPFANHPYSFVFIFGIMGFILLVMLLYFHYRRWI